MSQFKKWINQLHTWKLLTLFPKTRRVLFYFSKKNSNRASCQFFYIRPNFFYDDESCHLQESQILKPPFLLQKCLFLFPIQSGNLFARVTKNSLQIEWVKFQVVWSITFYSTGMRSRSKSWTAECPGLLDLAGGLGVKMSSDFNFTVRSWFLRNVRVKLYFKTQCLPPTHTLWDELGFYADIS